MKKVLAIIFTAAIALSVAACGTSNTTTTNPAETTVATTTVAATEATTVATDAATEPTAFDIEITKVNAEELIVATWVTTEGDGYMFNDKAVKIIFADGTETTGTYTIEHNVGEGNFNLTITDAITEETKVYTVTFASNYEMNVTAEGYSSTWTTTRSADDADFDATTVNADEAIIASWLTSEGDGYFFNDTAVKIIYSDGTEATGTYDIYKNEDTGAFELSITIAATEETTVYTVEFVSENTMNVTAEGYSSTWTA